MQARHRHHLPGARPGRRALASPRTSSSATSTRRPGFTRRGRRGARPGALLAPARPPRDPARREVGPAVRRGQADRQHGAGAVPRRPADRHGRAVRRARPTTRSTTSSGSSASSPPQGVAVVYISHRLEEIRADRRPGHRAQGRPHRRHRPAGAATPRPRERDPADDRPRRSSTSSRARPAPAADGAELLEVEGLGLGRASSPTSRFTRARRRDRRPRRAGRLRPLGDPRDGLRRPPADGGHGDASTGKALRAGIGRRRRCGPASAWPPRSARARAAARRAGLPQHHARQPRAGSPGPASSTAAPERGRGASGRPRRSTCARRTSTAAGAHALRRQPAEGRARPLAAARTAGCCCSTSRPAASTSARAPRSTR